MLARQWLAETRSSLSCLDIDNPLTAPTPRRRAAAAATFLAAARGDPSSSSSSSSSAAAAAGPEAAATALLRPVEGCGGRGGEEGRPTPRNTGPGSLSYACRHRRRRHRRRRPAVPRLVFI